MPRQLTHKEIIALYNHVSSHKDTVSQSVKERGFAETAAMLTAQWVVAGREALRTVCRELGVVTPMRALNDPRAAASNRPQYLASLLVDIMRHVLYKQPPTRLLRMASRSAIESDAALPPLCPRE
jgi:hypothetical protein